MRLENFRAPLPEEPLSSDPNRMEMEYMIHTGMEKNASRPSTSRRADGVQPFHPPMNRRHHSISTSRPSTGQRAESNLISRPPTSGKIEASSQEHVFMLAPKKSPSLHQHRRDDSKLEPEWPTTAKRKKV